MNSKQSIVEAGALFQIAEPTPSLPRTRVPGRGIGIDLGTTHSLVAVAARGSAPRALADDEGRVLLPSVVSYVNATVEIGQAARAQQVAMPTRVVSSVKRFMGRGSDDIDFRHPYAVVPNRADDKLVRFDLGQHGSVTPIEISAAILRVLKARAEAELNGPVDGAVITVPAYFDEGQRQATKDAGRIAGLQVYRLLAEPTAAALAYGLDRKEQGVFAVYDLGGGTFDISILRLTAGVFQVLATGGDTALGGDDFDRALAEDLLRLAGVAQPSAEQYEEAVAVARQAKEQLSAQTCVDVHLERSALHTSVTREAFEALIEPIARRTVVRCRQALRDAGVRVDELGGVVLVGGSTRVPYVRRLVEQVFEREPLGDIDPDRVVAYGAAILADVLSGSEREGVTLLDVVPLSLGIETMGGIVEKLIPRNATIPIAARQVFTNYSEQQTGMVVHVVQGERELARDCRSLATFELRGIPRLPPSMARVEVTFQVDTDALLTVTAREMTTGIKQSIEVRPTYGLRDEDVDRLVMDSLDHAQDDFAARAHAEATIELSRVVAAIRRALDDDDVANQLLSPAERASLDEAMTQASALLETLGPAQPGQPSAATEHPPAATTRQLEHAKARLEHVSEAFATRRMELALQKGMRGRAVEDVEASIEDDGTLEQRRAGHSPTRIEQE